ncbi:Ig-like domain-containing protein [Phytoactinopolyspora endophytica]|uniref:Ig-like domain-containing protein n=1 Tax=Phytoactinopolyspora endophytica TaxID=1642495 RepID=UPI00101BFCFA|nr:Ig-like domain-containing protein [Phytoactinopolyspora endophytica]
MSGVAASRCMLVACVSVIGGTLVAATANAQEADEDVPAAEVSMSEFDPEDFSDQAADLPADLIDAIERDLDISAERYLAQAAATRVADDVVDSLGDIVAAAWLDHQTLHIAVDSRSDQAAAAATGAQVHVGDALTDALRAAHEQGRVAYVDRQEGRVVPVETDLAGEPVRDSDLLSREGDESDADADASGTLSGGYGFWTHDSLVAYECTAGFNGVTGDGGDATLTAGHCSQGDSGQLQGPYTLQGHPLVVDQEDEDEPDEEDEDGDDGGLLPDDLPDLSLDPGHESETEDSETEDSEPEPIGELLGDASHFGDGNDAALLEVTSDEWTPRPEVAGLADEDGQRNALPVYDSIRPIAGAPVCASGAVSGWSCGTILDAESVIPVSGEDVSGFLLDACTLPGDGGGPIMIGNYAVGISSGSTWSGTDCADGGAEDGRDLAAAYPLSGGQESVQALYGDDWNLSVHVGAPTVVAPAEGDVTGRHPTIRGRADSAPGSTVVVSVGGADPVEAEVGADGRWRAPIDEPLPPGSHSYSATVTHTPPGADEPTTSEAVTGSFDVAEVASLVVLTPSEGEQTSNTQPHFAGTGDPGAQITLTFDDQSSSTVVDDDGTWTLSPPEGIRAGRFDATVTQDVDGTIDNVEVAGVGIVPGAPLVVGPLDDIENGYTVTGTGIPGSTVALRIERDTADEDDSSAGESVNGAEQTAAAADHLTQTDDSGEWQVEVGDVPPGAYTMTAVQAVDDLSSERSASTTLDIARPSPQGMRAAGGDDDLVDTGSASLTILLAGTGFLVLGAAVLLWTRRRFLTRS